MHKEHGLAFKAFVPTLMELLEDADGMVRDIARNTVIELFEYDYRIQSFTNPCANQITGMPHLLRNQISRSN